MDVCQYPGAGVRDWAACATGGCRTQTRCGRVEGQREPELRREEKQGLQAGGRDPAGAATGELEPGGPNRSCLLHCSSNSLYLPPGTP